MNNQFESLLEKHNNNIGGNLEAPAKSKEKRQKEKEPHRANKSATLDDFIEMVSKIVALSMKNEKVEFVPDEGRRIIVDSTEKVENPLILYSIVSRNPKGELKPRERENLVLEEAYDEKEGRRGRIYGQKFKCVVQFNIVASEYSTANKVMNNFEELILSYAHYFKKNGVAEIIFKDHFTDKNFDVFRQTVSVRSLQYYVEVEKLSVVFDSEIGDVQIISQ